MIMIMINICFMRLAGYISSLNTCSCKQQSLPGGGGGSHMKGTGMLIVSFRVAREEIYKNHILSVRFIYSIHAI